MAIFLVVLSRSGPQWAPELPLKEQSNFLAHASFIDQLVDSGFIVMGGPLADEHRVVYAVLAESQDAVHATLMRDPWIGTHLLIDSVEPWKIRFGSRWLSGLGVGHQGL
jgi:hypothetical protein